MGGARARGRSIGSTRRSRAWPSANRMAAGSCPAASSRCWRSRGRCSPTRGSLSWTSRRRDLRPSSSPRSRRCSSSWVRRATWTSSSSSRTSAWPARSPKTSRSWSTAASTASWQRASWQATASCSNACWVSAGTATRMPGRRPSRHPQRQLAAPAPGRPQSRSITRIRCCRRGGRNPSPSRDSSSWPASSRPGPWRAP